ncbi:hypothetical protein [Sphingosinicella microcystinivorans]|uniref:hypothetical protein n=1 Tax=Sphingosinicella microcystinivorans TaxID=335406 RepID=UPI000F8212C3|nr:hypothetical protein [Sphingosinicella microcystinivorans]
MASAVDASAPSSDMDASAAPSTAAFSPSFPALSLFPQAVAAKAIAIENPKIVRFDMLPIVLPRHFLVAADFFTASPAT